MFSGWVFSRVLLNYRDILALNKLRSYFQICKNGIQTWAENISQFNSFIYTSPSGSVGCNFFQFFCFNFFLHIFFRTWKTWKSDCSDFLRSGKLKIGTNMTKSGQLAGMLFLKGTVACYHSSYFGRSRSSHRPPTPPPILHRIHIELGWVTFWLQKSGKFSSLTLKNIKNNKCLAVKWLMNLYSKNEMYAAWRSSWFAVIMKINW